MPRMSASWKASVPMDGRADLPGDGDDRHRVHVGVGERGDEVRRAGAGGRHADADLAGRGGVALGGVAGALLVADQDVPHLDRVEQRVVGRAGSRRPGMPKTVSTSIASSESTRLCAPVTSIGVRALACCATCAGLGALGATGTTGVAGLVSLTAVTVSLGQPLSAAVVRAQKNPPVPWRDDGGSASDLKSIRRAGKVRGLGPQVNSPPGPYAVSTGETADPTIRNREVAHPRMPRRGRVALR